MVLVFTGNGKGKTSSAAGIALRAWGQAKRVLFISFLKGKDTAGEFKAIRRLNDTSFEVCSYGRKCPYGTVDCCPGEHECIIHRDNITAGDYQIVQQGLSRAERELSAGKWDLIILDEIINVFNLFPDCQKTVHDLVDSSKLGVDLILTGRNCPDQIMAKADLISELVTVRHPFNQGVTAKRGIDY